jgi:fibronectin-binding autotransporter adhesin
MKNFAWLGSLIVAAIVLVRGASAATTGFDRTTAGPWDYNNSTNWANGTINGLWDSSLTLTAAQTATFGVDTTVLTGLTFNQNGAFGLTLSSDTGTKTVTLGGDLAVATAGGPSATVTIGNSSNALNVNLGGVTRTATVDPFRTLTLVNVVSNGGLTKAGGGTLALNGVNTFAGGVTLNAGTLSLGNAAALGVTAGTFTIAGGTSLNSTSSNLVLNTNNAQAWNGDFTFLGTQNLNLGTGTVTLGGSRAVTVNANTLTVNGIISGSGLSLSKFGAGTLQLSSAGKSTFDGGLVLRGGTFRLDFANATTPASGLVADANTLTLGGGDLTVVAKSNAASAQTLGAVTLNTGRSVVTVNGTGTGTMNLATGAWTRNAGNTLNFVLGAGGTVTASPTLTNGITGPWATFNTAANTRYATVSGGTIASYSGGTTAATAADLTDTTGAVNYDLAAATGTMGSGVSVNTIRYAGATATLAPGSDFAVNGLLHVGTGTLTIGAGTVTIGGSRELVVNTANNAVTISGIVQNNAGGASALTKDGTSTLTLSGANTHTGGTTLNAGTLSVGTSTAIGSGTLTINAGSLALGASLTNNNTLIANGSFNVSGKFNTGTGQLRINGPLTISGGADNDNSPGVLFNNSITDSAGGSTLNAVDITWNMGSGSTVAMTLGAAVTLRGNQTLTAHQTGAMSALGIRGAIGDDNLGYGLTFAGTGYNPVGGNLSRGAGTALQAANTYTGATTINPGVTVMLGLNSAAGSLHPSSNIVNHGYLVFYRNNTVTQGNGFGTISGTGQVIGYGGTSVLNAANTYSGNTTAQGGVLQIGAATAGSVGAITSGPLGTGTLSLRGGTVSSDGATARTIINPVAIDANSVLGNATNSGSLVFSAPWTLNGNHTLTVNSTVAYNNDLAAGTRNFTKAGSGRLDLNGATTLANLTVSGGTLGVGSSGSLSLAGTTGTLAVAGGGTLNTEASGLTVTVGTFGVGNGVNAVGTARLGGTTSITASNRVVVGDGQGNSTTVASLTTTAGSTTTLNSPLIIVGNGGKTQGTVTLGSNASFTLAGTSGGRTSLTLAMNNASNAVAEAGFGTMDLTAGTASLSLSSLIVGQRILANTTNVSNTGNLLLGSSASNNLDVRGPAGTYGLVVIGYNSQDKAAVGTLTFGGGTGAITATDDSTAIRIGTRVGGTGTATGTLNLNGGTVMITTAGAAIAGGGGTSTLNLAGGVTLKAGAASNNWINSLTTTAIGTGGATIDTNSFDLGVAQAFSGAGGLTKAGVGKLTLSGANTYGGATSVNTGMLEIASTGSISNSSPLTLNGGTLRSNSATNYTGTFTPTSGTIGGTNLLGSLGGISIGTNLTLSPGNSPGTASTTSQTWAGGGTYLWEINSTAGSAGSDPGWDLLSGSDTLTISATSGSKFTLAITSLNLANTAGSVVGFYDELSYIWKVADFVNPVSGFDSSAFQIDTAGFANAFTGTFGVALGTSVAGGDNTEVYVTYASVPEPTTLGLLAGAGLTLVMLRRR